MQAIIKQFNTYECSETQLFSIKLTKLSIPGGPKEREFDALQKAKLQSQIKEKCGNLSVEKRFQMKKMPNDRFAVSIRYDEQKMNSRRYSLLSKCIPMR